MCVCRCVYIRIRERGSKRNSFSHLLYLVLLNKIVPSQQLKIDTREPVQRGVGDPDTKRALVPDGNASFRNCVLRHVLPFLEDRFYISCSEGRTWERPDWWEQSPFFHYSPLSPTTSGVQGRPLDPKSARRR